MGGHILEHEAKTILNRGIQAGKKEGIQDTLLELVRDGLLNAEEAAKRLRMDEHEFKKLL
ncbi:MAG: resolvase [Eubacteriales bacterium]|nr:resolvase [Eubacteriales bacterium]